MSTKIVSDSSSNIFTLPDIAYANVPLKIISGSKEYIDTPQLDVAAMMREMQDSKEKCGTSCPNVYEWEQAFEGSEDIFALTITSKMSGSFTAASAAAEQITKQNPGKKIFVFDSFSVGPGMQLMIEKLSDLIRNKLSFEEIKNKLTEYGKKTNLLFALQSLSNLAKNGRVNPAIAKIAGVLGIRLVGKAQDGALKLIHKSRGEKKAIDTLAESMLETGFCGGKVRISHCENEEAAQTLKEKILSFFPKSDIGINRCGGLCSFYAETGGLLVGFES